MEATQPESAAGQPQASGSRGGCLRMAASAVLILVLLGAVGAFAWYRITIAPIKSSEPYQMALKQLRKSPEVKKALGEPIEEVFWPPPSAVNLEGGPSRTTINFEVSGPNGGASVQVEARKLADKWGLSLLLVTPATGSERINDDTSETSGLDMAPPFNPGG